jgi:16S rRNA (cytidine1402-2'-O)-methyltransferase
MANGTLYLVPVPLCEEPLAPPEASAARIVAGIGDFLVENAKTARRWLKWYAHPGPLQSLRIETLGESGEAASRVYLTPLLEGRDLGLMSEAGCPGVADPGAEAVRLAHELGIRVVPLVGPSSILLALMASGLNGQRFAFHGYLPVARDQRESAIAELEQRSRRRDETEIVIETPYRNEALFESLLSRCEDDTLLCVARDLTSVEEKIETKTIARWRGAPPELKNRPAIFLLLANRRDGGA